METKPYTKPDEIEKQSFAIITDLLAGRSFPAGEDEIVKRVIHTTADFEYAENLIFSPGAVNRAKEALAAGATLERLGGQAVCFMADPEVAAEAKARGVTRAVVSMERAAGLPGELIFAIGNAPTALLRLRELIREGALSPALVIGVPVGFVNVVEAKELFLREETPYIIARGRKGGSNVAAAIVNALLYQLVKREGF